jgi:hypothetical protein
LVAQLISTHGVRVLDGIKHHVPFFGRHRGPNTQALSRSGQRFLPSQVSRLRVDGLPR